MMKSVDTFGKSGWALIAATVASFIIFVVLRILNISHSEVIDVFQGIIILTVLVGPLLSLVLFITALVKRSTPLTIFGTCIATLLTLPSLAFFFLLQHPF